MRSRLRLLALLGGVVFAALSLWSLYWTVALQRHGRLVTFEIVAHRVPAGAASDGTMIEYLQLWKYEGREELTAYSVDAASAPPVGTRVKLYLVSDIAGPSHFQMPGEWYHAWRPAALFFLATGVLLWAWRVLPGVRWVLHGYALGWAVLIVGMLIYYSDAFGDVLKMVEYVGYQRAYQRAGPRME